MPSMNMGGTLSEQRLTPQLDTFVKPASENLRENRNAICSYCCVRRRAHRPAHDWSFDEPRMQKRSRLVVVCSGQDAHVYELGTPAPGSCSGWAQASGLFM